ncbi:ABC transporter permease [Fusobacterium sp. MFO224]|uniref:ABC transporter permease n=1 Tax=Fusobacterium sp. MFO224 TaxID=3378070 RepID=UPI003853C9E0
MEFWLALKMILGNKKKVIFPLLAVISGITALIITLSISRGGEMIINNNLSSIGENRIMIGGDSLSKRDMDMIENYPFVEYAMFPRARVKLEDTYFIAYSRKALKTLGLNNLRNNEIIIDKKQYKDKNIGDVLSISLNGNERRFIVRDMYEEKNPFELMKEGYRIIVSQDEFEELFNMYNYDSMIISFDENENPEDYVQGLINKLSLNKGGYSNLRLLETPEVYKKIVKIKKMVNRTLGIIAFVSLALGAFGILNLIGNNIKARSKHIGILRAMGMEKNNVVKTFILEAVIISLVGSFIGIFLGVTGSFLIGKLINIYPVFNVFQILFSLLLSLGIGILMGVYPTKRINSESIIKILKGD